MNSLDKARKNLAEWTEEVRSIRKAIANLSDDDLLHGSGWLLTLDLKDALSNLGRAMREHSDAFFAGHEKCDGYCQVVCTNDKCNMGINCEDQGIWSGKEGCVMCQGDIPDTRDIA